MIERATYLLMRRTHLADFRAALPAGEWAASVRIVLGFPNVIILRTKRTTMLRVAQRDGAVLIFPKPGRGAGHLPQPILDLIGGSLDPTDTTVEDVMVRLTGDEEF